ncbi:hypothetical protein [Metabacillus sp. 84]|uniref:hypothetical protein n=1 Tax=unclassified Metabacillus TaxID=2675274 RepID=UPI003CF60E76
MKKKTALLIVLLLMAAGGGYFIFTQSSAETSTKIEDNEGNSISYLSEKYGKSVLNTFNFDKQKITKSFKLNQDQDLYAVSYYHPIEKKTLIMNQQSEPYGYQVYMQNPTGIQKLGFLENSIQEALYTDEFAYVLVYSRDAGQSVKLNQYKLDNWEKPVQTWEIPGSPKRMLANHESGKIFILTAEAGTAMHTLDEKSGELTSKVIAEDPYDLNASVIDGKLWILPREKLDSSGMKSKNNQAVRSVMQLDTETGETLQTAKTKHPPKFMAQDSNYTYIISGTPNSSYLELYEHKNMNKRIGTVKLKADAINGFVSTESGNFLFTNKGVFKAEGTKVQSAADEEISPKTDLRIH